MDKTQLFLALSEYDILKKCSRLVNTNEFVGEYSSLKLGNGGGWCRMDLSGLAKKYKFVTRKGDGSLEYSWNDISEHEKMTIEDDVKELEHTGGNMITHMKIYGTQNDKCMFSRSIRKNIREHFKDCVCVVCGNSKIEIDHKNGLYNDPRVWKCSTQTIEDFQPLCRHCNGQKRQSIVYSKQTGLRYPATKIPALSVFGVDYVMGDETFDENDINAMRGTYWYDPVYFMEKLKEMGKR
jgi:hypothetical protein